MKNGILLLFFLRSPFGFAFSSNHLKNFEFQQCSQQACLTIAGKLAFISLNQNTMAGFDAKLIFNDKFGKTSSIISCDRFSIGLKTQNVFCEFTQKARSYSVFFDAKLNRQMTPPFSGEK